MNLATEILLWGGTLFAGFCGVIVLFLIAEFVFGK